QPAYCSSRGSVVHRIELKLFAVIIVALMIAGLARIYSTGQQTDPQSGVKNPASPGGGVPEIPASPAIDKGFNPRIAIEPTDDTYRRLLKTRFNLGQIEVYRTEIRLQVGTFDPIDISNYLLLQEDMREVAIELWKDEPNNLVPALSDLLNMAVEHERFIRA